MVPSPVLARLSPPSACPLGDVQVFVQPASKDGAESREGLPFQMVARNLVGLVNESKAGELASLEEVVSSLVKDTLDPEKDTVLDPEVL